MQRNQKICKIIEEFSLYILENSNANLNIDINQGDVKTVLTFTLTDIEDAILEYITQRIKGERDRQIEEYGWELMGEGDSDDDLGIINALIDELNVNTNERKTIIRMVRYE